MSESFPIPDESYAAVDLGSNSFHLVIAKDEAGDLVVVDRMRDMVQLALGLDKKQRLTEDARRTALECLRRFGERIGHMPEANVRAVGTNTLRRARNAAKFLLEAEAALGHPIETISGVEEARLIYIGVTHGQTDPSSRRLVLDIGGGSTELIVGEAFTPLALESLYMGCASMTREAFPDGKITAKRWDTAVLAALQEFEPVQSRFRALGWTQAVGASGTVRSVAHVAREAGWIDDEITVKALRKLRDALVGAGHVEAIAALSERRGRVFPGGAAILTAAFEALSIERMIVSDVALREGLLVDLLGRVRKEDARSRSVSALGDRYHVDWKQAGSVEQTALSLLSQLASGWRLESPEAQRMLSWAAQIHEIGLDIAHAHYHKHGEYIVRESDLLGFSRDEQLLLATLVRSHRRKFPVVPIRELPHRRRTVERLAILLRLAVVLNRSRSPEYLPQIGVEVDKKALRLTFPEDWLDGHPLVRAGLEQEKDYLEAIGYRLEFG
jgi:exopolyphosphatase/guanosine-5'-triphosphate,3'-diphosphate pyrophosphatase